MDSDFYWVLVNASDGSGEYHCKWCPYGRYAASGVHVTHSIKRRAMIHVLELHWRPVAR